MSILVVEGSNGSGKSTVIKDLKSIYNITDKKSVPDWFREYIDFARSCPFPIQKEIYKIGHDANYFDCDKNSDYIFDRYAYSTIIRINYSLGLSTEDTVKEILAYKKEPDVIFVMHANLDVIEQRLKNRDNFPFDANYYYYENEVYELLSNEYDKMYLIENNDNIDLTLTKICDIIDKNTKVRKR